MRKANNAAAPILNLKSDRETSPFGVAVAKEYRRNMKPNVNGQDKKAMYANSNRLRIAQRRILFVVAGAWSADFFFNPSEDIALVLNLSILALLIVCVVLQVALMRSS
ncbi:hypothetical protein [Comamonas sp. wu1-DMT]|uniref:hypothetical protein n=1 Tax=Comamonas sp. wu1-DMT TaxID=3126390 RepID=UPI0032E3E58E